MVPSRFNRIEIALREDESAARDVLDYMRLGPSLATSTAYLYDWNMLPLGQLLWTKELESYKQFPPLQAPEAYNLDGIIAEMKASRAASHAGTRHIAVAIAGAALSLGVVSAHAGPCTAAIAQFEQAVRQSAGAPDAGPMAPQSIGAQLDRQPTPGSIKQAEERAQAAFAATLAPPSGSMPVEIAPAARGRSPRPSACTICNERFRGTISGYPLGDDDVGPAAAVGT